ncbi:hypothetical protein B7494_g287 [Chlorociboria aeruginascens]|nr:hypothetical protein B7494_g287 [Chlorociboria aeruginascens]
MKGWKACSTPEDRSCWLKGPKGEEFNINTDYEDLAPAGILRKYEIDVSSMVLSPDGFKNLDGKTYNQTFPGPWIQACWGDQIEVNVTNHLQYNGTSVHWHGLRQLGSVEMDGVVGVTQCPIAPGDSFTYRFNTTQYGTSWYHSHYSLQYSDGLRGPLTIYGPSSSEYDEAINPLLISDWNHRSAFSDFFHELGVQIPGAGTGPPNMTSIILNGSGRENCTPLQKQNGQYFQGKKYLLRLINTSTDTIFHFSIDNHNLTVVEADFVPIKPYNTTNVLVGIGQRYHVILDANPNDKRQPKDQNYWIRTVPATGCSSFETPQDNRTGILRYANAQKVDPTTTISGFNPVCADEPYESLIPVIPWKVGDPVNQEQQSTFQVGLTEVDPATNEYPGDGNFSRWDITDTPLFLNLSNPTLLNPTQTNFPSELDVINFPSQPVTADSWIYLLITTTGFPFDSAKKNFVPAAHPIHLHGHDFVILQQSDKPYWDPLVNLKKDNPPRRDVALLPSNGFLIIAFKADNPGAWLLHCHINWHSSSGLGLQVLERQSNIKLSQSSTAELDRVHFRMIPGFEENPCDHVDGLK